VARAAVEDAVVTYSQQSLLSECARRERASKRALAQVLAHLTHANEGHVDPLRIALLGLLDASGARLTPAQKAMVVDDVLLCTQSSAADVSMDTTTCTTGLREKWETAGVANALRRVGFAL